MEKKQGNFMIKIKNAAGGLAVPLFAAGRFLHHFEAYLGVGEHLPRHRDGRAVGEREGVRLGLPHGGSG